MPLQLSYAGAGGAGFGIIVTLGSLILLGLGLGAGYLFAPKNTVRRCADAKLAAVLAFVIGNIIPLLVIPDVVLHPDRGVTTVAVCLLLLNAGLAVSGFVSARRRQGELREQKPQDHEM